MVETRPPPLVGVTACQQDLEGGRPFHVAGDKYVVAALRGAGAIPLIIPALGDALDIAELLDRLDGLLVTGSASNVEPHHYDGGPSRPDTRHDAQRDATTLPLIRAAVEGAVPLFAICRGIQELNVAFGGTLHQHVEEQPGRRDHREDESVPVAERYGPAHPVELSRGGHLEAILGCASIEVNSLHGQGIDRPAEALSVEAVADDGTVEGVWVTGAPAFALGVQWHPEWRVTENPDSLKLFAAFGEAASARRISR